MVNEASGKKAGDGAAVFLSYASQDADAARRLCTLLRAAGIEVWFDQSQLRGGDAWDQRIRQQIRDCALFVPVISANTSARAEGYFRLEWRLAEQRTHLMARNRAFIVPVCVDDTKVDGADMPDSFVSVQWTRLPGGEATPEFVERLLRLRSDAEASAPVPQRPAVAASLATAAPASQPAPGRFTPVVLALSAAALALAYLALDRLVLAPHRAPPPPAPPIAASAASTGAAIPEKSIAVLPFVDMSEKHDQEYFSDGLAEELLDLLAQVPDLQVAARTSSFYFKGKAEDLATIAQKLKVAHVLEGSVRKAGSTVRVTAQLIRADNGYHLWSKTYDRDVRGIFKVQDEIAAAVVAALKIALLADPQAAHTRRVANPEAYSQYLLGRQALTKFNGRDQQRAADAFRRATALDPGFAPAWAGLADALYWIADAETSAVALEEARRGARAAADKAVALQPTLAYGHEVRGVIRASIDFDLAGAGEDFRRALEVEPDSPDVLAQYAAAILVPTGKLDDAVAALQKAVRSDPLNARCWTWLGLALIYQGNAADAREALNRSLDLSPEQVYAPHLLALSYFLEGQPEKALTYSQRSTLEAFRLFGTVLANDARGHRPEAEQALAELIAKFAFNSADQIAEIYAWRGDRDRAFAWLDRAYAQRDAGFVDIETDPMLRRIRNDPRFAKLVARLHLKG